MFSMLLVSTSCVGNLSCLPLFLCEDDERAKGDTEHRAEHERCTEANAVGVEDGEVVVAVVAHNTTFIG